MRIVKYRIYENDKEKVYKVEYTTTYKGTEFIRAYTTGAITSERNIKKTIKRFSPELGKFKLKEAENGI
jgi:hypothetical protein